jgi:hypothetical protein
MLVSNYGKSTCKQREIVVLGRPIVRRLSSREGFRCLFYLLSSPQKVVIVRMRAGGHSRRPTVMWQRGVAPARHWWLQ